MLDVLQRPHAPSAAPALPFPIWTLDGAAMDAALSRMRAAGGADGDPRLLDLALDEVRVVGSNAAAADLFDADDTDALLRPMRYLFAGARDAARRLFAARLAGERGHVEDMTVRTLSGRNVEVLLHVSFPAPTASAAPTFVLMTARPPIHDAVASIVHEVRQPLAAIATNAGATLRWLAHDTPDLAKVGLLADRIAACARRASDILVRIQQTAAGDAPAHRTIDLNHLAETACEMVREEAERRRIELALDVAAVPARTHGDPVQLQQVVVNLLTNALQAIDGAAPPRRRITVSTCAWTDGMAGLSVRDTGPGIPQDHIERIFARAFTTKAEGMGVGLAISRAIARQHGGEIRASNNADGGACLDVLLPTGRPGS